MIHAINTAYKSVQHDFLIKTLTPLRLFGTKPAQVSILSPLILRGQVVRSKPKSPSEHLSEIRVQLIRRANKKLPILNTGLTIMRQTSLSQITSGNRVKAV